MTPEEFGKVLIDALYEGAIDEYLEQADTHDNYALRVTNTSSYKDAGMLTWDQGIVVEIRGSGGEREEFRLTIHKAPN